MQVAERAPRLLHEGRLGVGFGNHHHVTDDGNNQGGPVGLAHGQAHFGAFGPANQLHGFVEAHAFHVHGLGRTLGHPQNDIAHLQLALPGRRRPGHDVHHLEVPFVLLQLRARTLQTARHGNVEVVAGNGGEILRVRVVGIGNHVGKLPQPVVGVVLQLVGKGLVVKLKHALARLRFQLNNCARALRDGGGRSHRLGGRQWLVLLAGSSIHQLRQLGQGLVLQHLAPLLALGGRVNGVSGLGGVGFPTFGRRKIKGLGQHLPIQHLNFGGALGQQPAGHVQKLMGATLQLVVDFGLKLPQLRHLGGTQ